MSSKKAIAFSSLTLLLVSLSLSPALQAAIDPSEDSQEVSKLLSEAKTQAIQLKDDASDMESFPMSNLSWETHANKLMEIKEHVNNLSKTISKLNNERGAASSWQKQAIDRVNPVLRELVANTESIIEHLNKEKGRLLNTTEHKDYLATNAELATRMAALVTDFVDYGQTKAKFERLTQKLEIAER